MKATIAVFESHQKALKALEILNDAHYPLKNLSLIGKAEIIDKDIHVKSYHIKEIGVGIGLVAGPILGILTGVGLFTIPGFGVLYGAGAVVGAMAGIEFGAITAGAFAIFETLGIHKDHVIVYEENLKEGKFLLVVQGSPEDIKKAELILENHGQHQHLLAH